MAYHTCFKEDALEASALGFMRTTAACPTSKS